MVEIVVHLLLINEYFFVRNLYVSGNGNDFSRTLGSNIWDYVIAHARKLHEKRAMFFWAVVAYKQRPEIVTDLYQLQDFIFV